MEVAPSLKSALKPCLLLSPSLTLVTSSNAGVSAVPANESTLIISLVYAPQPSMTKGKPGGTPVKFVAGIVRLSGSVRLKHALHKRKRGGAAYLDN